jgi:MYXO-CTERM domain-containing protein
MRLVAPVLAVLLSPLAAWGQLVPLGFVSRAGSPRGATTLAARINRVDCAADEVITVTASLPAPTAGVPELWVSETTACDPSVREPGLGATCFAICSQGERRACTLPYAQGEREYTFRVPVRWIIDPRLGLCSAVTGRRYLQLVVGDTVVARSSPSIRVDLVAPQAPLAVVAALGGTEQTASITWGYATPDAGTVVTADAGDVDAGDAGVTDVVDVPVVEDVPADTGSGPSAEPEVETLARFYVLCSPAPGTAPTTVIDGGTCPAVPFPGLDVNDDAQLRRWQCAPTTVESTARTVTIQNLPPTVPHRFGVVAEDLAGNRSAVTYANECVRPRAITDFWEEYHRQGGQAEPGACAVGAPGAGRSTVAGLWLALAGVVVAARRRRRR